MCFWNRSREKSVCDAFFFRGVHEKPPMSPAPSSYQLCGTIGWILAIASTAGFAVLAVSDVATDALHNRSDYCHQVFAQSSWKRLATTEDSSRASYRFVFSEAKGTRHNRFATEGHVCHNIWSNVYKEYKPFTDTEYDKGRQLEETSPPTLPPTTWGQCPCGYWCKSYNNSCDAYGIDCRGCAECNRTECLVYVGSPTTSSESRRRH
jgi:hypothetical protein